MAEAPLALIFISVLLGAKSLCILSEMWLRLKDYDVKTRTFWLRFFAALIGCFVLVLGSIATTLNPIASYSNDKTCTEADADIIGDGVRTATWAQVGILAFSAITGTFHFGPSGVQEVGAGLIVTHIALASALLVPMCMKTLSPVDSILGTMILDAQNVALSIQLLSKQTLASRWQTYVTIGSQSLGLIAIGFLINNFTEDGLAKDTCSCISAYWWGWLNNCSLSSERGYRSIWAYYALRIITTAHCSINSHLSTSPFDQAKKREEERPCEKCDECLKGEKDHPGCRCDICEHCKRCPRCNNMNCQHCRTIQWGPDVCNQCQKKRGFSENEGFIGRWKYSQISASVGNMYIEYSAYALLSLLAAEGLLRAYNIKPSSPWSAIGQLTSTVIAVATAIRFIWVFSMTFWKKEFAPV